MEVYPLTFLLLSPESILIYKVSWIALVILGIDSYCPDRWQQKIAERLCVCVCVCVCVTAQANVPTCLQTLFP